MISVTDRDLAPVKVTEDNIQFALMALQAADDIAIDTETSGLNVRNKVDYCMGFPVDVPGFTGYLPFRHKADNLPWRYLDPFIKIIGPKPLIWHNRKFDYHSVATLGIDPVKEFTGPQYDTLMLAHLMDEELYSKELSFLTKRFLKVDKVEDDDNFYKFGKVFGFENIPVDLAVKRSEDARLTRKLRDFLWPRIVEQELDAVYWDTEAPFTTLLYIMEQRGIGVDADFCTARSERGRSRMATIQRALGGKNPSSPVDLGNLLLSELKLPVLAHTSSCEKCKNGWPVDSHEGKPSFNKMVVNEYDDILKQINNPTAQLITEYRGWQKAVTSLYEPMVEKRGPDGLIRTEFKQHGTVTRRLSSSDPNLQQIPRASDRKWNGDAKRAFLSEKAGHAVYGWDYSQLELRLAAAYGKEAILLAEFAKPDADPFAALAPGIFGYFDQETRHKTKNCFVYPSLYGAGLGKVALVLGKSQADTKPLYDNYKATIPGITKVSAQVNKIMEQRKYIKYWDNSRRHIRNREDSHKAWNSLLQGGGAQLVKKAMLRCQEFEDNDCQMVLQVHDEITFDIHREAIKDYEPKIIEAMTDWDFGVNLHVEGKEWK